MKRIILLAAIFITAATYAQDKKAAALLDEVSQKTKSYKSFKADFSYTMENKSAKINESKTGTLLVSGDKYRLTVVGQLVICDGRTIWTYIKESNEVQINNLDEKDDSFTPSRLLTSYSKNYKSKIVKDKSVTDPNTECVELIPISSKNYTKADLVIDKSKKQIKRFSLYDKNGNVFTYKVSKFQTDVPTTKGDFTFEAAEFPGAEIIDMR